MTKLKLPPAVLKGTPLTESEMKEILGGMQFYQRCSCTLSFTNGSTYSQQVDARSGTECNTECQKLCAATGSSSTSGPKCFDYDYKYEEGRY